MEGGVRAKACCMTLNDIVTLLKIYPKTPKIST